jgi:hypothetical protein
MAETNISDPQELARAFGLDRLADRFPDDVERAAAFAKSLAERLPKDLTAADEPAHVFRAREGDAAP